MIRKFAMGAAFVFVMAGAMPAQAPQDQQQTAQSSQDQSSAQQTPPPDQQSAQQAPAGTSGSQETEEEIGPRRKRTPTYSKYTFNVGAGANLASGTTKTFVKGGGPVFNAGVTRNYSRYFGFRLDFFWVDLPLRSSALQMAQSTSALNYAFALTLDPMFNIPVTKRYGIFALVGPAYLHRSGSLNNSTVVPGSPCNAFFKWWGNCNLFGLPVNRSFLSTGLNEFGYDYGGGVFRKLENGKEIYADFRGLHGSGNSITTDSRTLTVGVRW